LSISHLAGAALHEEPAVNVVEDPEHNDFAVILDSGAADHVVDSAITPGYGVQESFGSKVGAGFVAANGERIPNRGQMTLEMKSGNIPIKSVFQVAKISKPLWSVGRLCDQGFTVEFGKDNAKVKQNGTNKIMGTFQRHNGLYVGNLQLRNPKTGKQSFQRPA